MRPGVWGAATYSATAALLLLELMCGKTLDPKEARDHFELIRGCAWKLVRHEPGGKDGTQASYVRTGRASRNDTRGAAEAVKAYARESRLNLDSGAPRVTIN